MLKFTDCQVYQIQLSESDSLMQRFGEKLRTLRDRSGTSFRELATEFGFRSHAHLARVEKGEKTPNAELILKIAYFFDVSTDVLMKDELELD